MVARTTITIKLTPKAAQNRIGAWETDSSGKPFLKISVTAVPEKGKANEALIALLSKEWKVAKSEIVILKGETDRIKTLSVPETLGLPKS